MGIDTYIAFGLVGIVIVVFLISQMGILPRKGLLFVIGALAGVFGIALFRKQRTARIREDFKKREKQLNEKLSRIKKRYGISEQELQRVKAELGCHCAAYEKTIMQIEAKNKEEKERIDDLYGDELHREFLDVIDNYNARG